MPKARNNSDGEEPYVKTKVVPNYPDKLEIIYQTTTLESHSQKGCDAYTSDSNGKT